MHQRGLDTALPKLDRIVVISSRRILTAWCDRKSAGFRNPYRIKKGAHRDGLKFQVEPADLRTFYIDSRLEFSNGRFVPENHLVRRDYAAACNKDGAVFAQQAPLRGVIGEVESGG